MGKYLGVVTALSLALVGIGWLTGQNGEEEERKNIRTQNGEEMRIPKRTLPSGFRWYVNQKIKAGCAVPNHWNVKEDDTLFAVYEPNNIGGIV